MMEDIAWSDLAPTSTEAGLKAEPDPLPESSLDLPCPPHEHRSPSAPVYGLPPACHDGDKDIWYPDGNVVVFCCSDGRAKWFKLYRARLALYCHYFENLFSSRESTETAPLLEGCPVYAVPAGVSCDGLVALIAFLEKPGEYWGQPLAEDLAILLLTTAHALSCPVVLDLSKRRLIELWNGNVIPGDSPADAGRTVSWKEAIAIINLGRKYDVPEVLQRAFYEALANKDFLKIHKMGGTKIDLPDEDVELLWGMRLYLDHQWPKYLLAAPHTDDVGRTKATPAGERPPCTCETQSWGWERKDRWLEFALPDRSLRDGGLDPLRYNLVRRRKGALKTLWCQCCLRDKEVTWKSLRAECWDMLGEMINT